MSSAGHDTLLDVLRAAEAVLAARENQMLTSEEWDALAHAVAAATQTPANTKAPIDMGANARSVIRRSQSPSIHDSPCGTLTAAAAAMHYQKARRSRHGHVKRRKYPSWSNPIVPRN